MLVNFHTRNLSIYNLTGSFYQPTEGTGGQLDILDRDIEYAKVHAQVEIHLMYRI